MHLVYVIGREYQYQLRIFLINALNILKDRVGGTQVPGAAYPSRGWNDLDELAQFGREYVPCLPDVSIETQSFVLGKNIDAVQAGVDAVGKGNVY
jgi:hypothetical protein